jgi:FixJ family two-component response regulator
LFDLVIVDQTLPEGTGLDWIEQLRKAQPAVPVLLMAVQLDVAAVVKGIRLGVADVLRQPDDAAAVLLRANKMLRPDAATALGEATHDVRLSAALESVLAQPDRQQDGRVLEQEREALAADWAAIHEEQLRLRKERHRLRNETMVREGERARFEQARTELERCRQENRNRHQQTQTEAARLDGQRHQLAADLEALREQEANLRDYEARLRELQRKLETEQISRTREREAVVAGAAELEQHTAWDKIQRATAILESERKNLIDERLAIKEHLAALQQREAELAQREARLAERERVSASPPLPPPKGKSALLTSAPFLAAKSFLNLGRTG